MGQFEELLAADSGESKCLDQRPRPEGCVLFAAEVARRVVCAVDANLSGGSGPSDSPRITSNADAGAMAGRGGRSEQLGRRAAVLPRLRE